MTALRKAYYRVCAGGKENRPMYFDYKRLIQEMEEMDNQMIHTGEYYKTGDKAGMPKTTKGEYNGKLTSTVNLLKDRMMDSRYGFLFHDEPQSYLYEVMEAILGQISQSRILTFLEFRMMLHFRLSALYHA